MLEKFNWKNQLRAQNIKVPFMLFIKNILVIEKKSSAIVSKIDKLFQDKLEKRVASCNFL